MAAWSREWFGCRGGLSTCTLLRTARRRGQLVRGLVGLAGLWLLLVLVSDTPDHMLDPRPDHRHSHRQILPEDRFNSTLGPQDDIIVYNRVPKCASTSLRTVFHQTAARNKLTVHVSRIYTQEFLNHTGQETLIQHLSTMNKPLLFIRHLFFVDFTQFGQKQPIYINMIRDPLERLVSDYYFKRYNLRHMFPMSEQQRRRSYNECVQRNYSECVEDSPKGYFRIIPYFCGMDTRCLKPSEWALNRAKQHVEQQYLVVSTIEHFREFLETLERLLPRAFRGVLHSYGVGGSKLKKMAKTAQKDAVDEKTVVIMKQKLRYDYDFYHFVEQRFQNLYNSLFHQNISSNGS